MRDRRAASMMPFLEVEIPAAVLLRHQAALQAVGEPPDGALQMGELLVEIGTQAVELGDVAQFLGIDRLVKAGGEGAVVVERRQVGEGCFGAMGLAGVLGVGHVGVFGGLLGFRLAGLAVAGIALVGGGLHLVLGGRIDTLGLVGAAVGVVLIAGLVAVVVLVAGLAGKLVGHVERRQDIAHFQSEARLVLDGADQARQVAAGALLDPVAPQLDDLAARLGRGLAGQALAHHQGDGVLQRRVGALGDLLIIGAVIALLEHGGEVVGDACHAVGAERLDARLFDRIEDGAGIAAAGRVGAMDRGVVAGQAQRQRIADAAGDGDVVGGHLARRLGQARLHLRQHRPVGGERHLQLRLAGNGAHAAGHRALERLGRVLDRLGAKRLGSVDRSPLHSGHHHVGG